jgi:hypothetical protein
VTTGPLRLAAGLSLATVILVAALAFAIAYVRNSVTLARIFLREARRRRAASSEVGPASRESLPR